MANKILEHIENSEKKLQSILDIDNGSIKEKADYELEKVMANMGDVNTDHKGKRKIIIELSFSTNEERDNVNVEYSVKSKLQPPKKRDLNLFMSNQYDTETKELFTVLKEHTSGVSPDQINLDGEIRGQETLLIGHSYKQHIQERKKDAIENIYLAPEGQEGE